MPLLTPERWRAVGPYLDQALEIADGERDAWVREVETADAVLAADLRALLAEYHSLQESSFLERPVRPPRPDGGAASLAGQTLGAYRLVSCIGQGGMGSVWLAERCDGRFEGRAAIKLLNIARMGKAGEERFRREGNILARLTHPHIAHLIDAGVSSAGQPYLVLEHVDGQAIDRYCDERALDIESRLRLFLDVLEAVEQAHANLIVHRDIKPANVLVSVDGQVKLLDFGIAKLLEGESEWGAERSGDTSPLTREMGAALTPEYAAPEQVAGGQITTATDVYALGILLYVLLTGQHPAGGAVHSPARLIQAIVDEEPRRMSDAVAAADEAAEVARHAAQLGTTPARLGRLLHGDLDTIVAKALKKNPRERYASVTALADDLRRSLRHEPISARPDTLRYRTVSFVRRHRQGVAMTVAVALLLGGATLFHTNRLATATERAQREAAKAAKVSELLTNMLAGADPYARATPEPTVRGLLDAGAARAEKELAGQPEVQAEILTVMGRIYRKLGVYDRARQLLERALAAGRSAFGAEHVRVAQSLHDLGTLLTEMGDYDGARRSLEEALTLRRKLLPHEHADLAVTLTELSRVYQDQGSNARSEPLQREALEIRRTVLGPAHRETAVSVNGLASVLRLNGDLDGAEALLRQGLEINRAAIGDEHPNTATNRHDLALIALARGDTHTAGALLGDALATQRRTLGNQHPILATTLNNLSRVLVEEGRYDEAVAALEEALDIARAALAADHQFIAIYSINLASVHLIRKQPAAAEPLLRQALAIRARAPGLMPSRRRTVPEDDWSVDAVKRLLGAALVALGRYDEAEAILLHAEEHRGLLDHAPHPETRSTIIRLVELYDIWGRPDRAAAQRALFSS